MVVCVTQKLSIFLYSYAINLALQRCWTSKSNIAKIFCNRSSRRYNTNSHILEIGCVSCSVGGSSFIRPPLRFTILTLLKSTPTRVESGQLQSHHTCNVHLFAFSGSRLCPDSMYKIFQRMFPNVTILFNIEASFANLLQHQMYLGGYKQYPFQLNEYKLSLSLHVIINVAEEYNPNRRRRSGAITMLTLSLSRPPDPLFLPSLICAKP